jgi:hypothetical protein
MDVAQILIKGPMATIEVTMNNDGVITAQCIEHDVCDGRLAPPGNCPREWEFSTWADAKSVPDLETHADRG